jgi:hypothetical protein
MRAALAVFIESLKHLGARKLDFDWFNQIDANELYGNSLWNL